MKLCRCKRSTCVQDRRWNGLFQINYKDICDIKLAMAESEGFSHITVPHKHKKYTQNEPYQSC